MLLKQDIKLAYDLQNEHLTTGKNWIDRAFLNEFKPTGNHIEIISGVRRCGKSTLLKQIIRDLGVDYAWFSFEDVRIHGFSIDDFPKLDEVIGHHINTYFFDEIQNVPSWEVFVRQLHERGHKVYLTGSNASLLSRELGTRLTGRHLLHKLFPFSYPEFLEFKGLTHDFGNFREYLKEGGFPEYNESGNPAILQELLKDIILKDVAIRYGIRNTEILTDVALFMLSNIGKEFTYNSIRKTFSIGSPSTVSDYLTWLADSYLFFFLTRFSWSVKNQKVNPRKVYAIDNGLVRANTLSFSEDRGRLLENAVFLNLLMRNERIFYFKEEQECDFVIFDRNRCSMLVQVCETLTSENLKREVGGLTEAMEFFGIREGFILTLEQQDQLSIAAGTIHVMPAVMFFQK